MSYPPQQPWHPASGGQQPQQWGGPHGNSGPVGGQPPAGGQQWGGHQGQQPQQWGGQQPQGQQWGQQPQGQQQWSGQQQWGGQPQMGGQQPQQWGPGAPQQWGPTPGGQSSKKGLWIGLGVAAAVIAIILVIVFAMGGGKYAGDTRPPLPSSFGGWKKGEGMFGLETYSKGSQEVTVFEFEATGGSDDGELETIEGLEIPDDVETSTPSKGVTCGSYQGSTACTIMYKDDKGFVVSGVGKSAVEDAAVELSKA